MPAAEIKTHNVAPDDRRSANGVAELLRSGSIESVSLVVRRPEGRAESVTLNGSLVETIRDLIGLVQTSDQVGMFSDDPELTPEQASDLLGMSRPTVVQRIKSGELPARMVGAHHRIRMSEALAFKRHEEERTSLEISARRESARFAVANTVMEGGTVLLETEALLEHWSQGEIDDEELIEQTVQRFAPGA